MFPWSLSLSRETLQKKMRLVSHVKLKREARMGPLITERLLHGTRRPESHLIRCSFSGSISPGASWQSLWRRSFAGGLFVEPQSCVVTHTHGHRHTHTHTPHWAPHPHPRSLRLISRSGLIWSLSSVYLCESLFLLCSLLESSRTASWSSFWPSSWLSPSWQRSLFLSEDTDVSALPW